VFQLVLAFAVLNARQWQLATGRWRLGPVWAGALAAGTVVAGSLRMLRKRTHLLEDRATAPDSEETELPETKWPVRQSRTGQDVVAGDAGVPSRPT